MLDEKVLELAYTRIGLELGEQTSILSREIQQTIEEMAARGLGRSGILLRKIGDICSTAIGDRAQMAWEILSRVILTAGVSYSDDLAEQLKSIVGSYLPQSHNYVKNFIESYANVLAPSKPAPANYRELDQAREIALLRIHSEIDLFIMDLRSTEKIVRQELPPGGNVHGDDVQPRAPQDLTEGWEGLLHPAIRSSSLQQYRDGHWRDAVLNAFIAVFDLVRTSTGLDLDGERLVTRVFSVTNPLLVVADLRTDSGKNDQVGFMMVLQGVYRGIRNPKAHSLQHDLNAFKAAQYLVTVSLLARRIDEAESQVQGGTA